MNKFLLDTNILLWYFWGSNRVESVRNLFTADVIDVYYSPVSLWEIAIKIRNGKLNLNFDELCIYTQKHDFLELPLTGDCLKSYMELPNIHKDPFDHILVAQALAYPMHFITGDALLADYSSLVMAI